MSEEEVKAWVREYISAKTQAFLSSEDGLKYQSDVYSGFGALRMTEGGEIERVSPEEIAESTLPNPPRS
jgi:hypothetical protein